MTALAPTAEAMQPDADRSGAAHGWRPALLRLGLCWLAVALLFWRDIADMVSIWWEISTYNHILLIPPIIGWLVSQRIDGLKRIAPATWAGGLVPLAGAAMLWVLGDAGGFSLLRHAAIVAMLQSSVLALLGWRVAMALAFPLAYALFLIPAGEELVPWLQTITADMAMRMLEWSGVPAHIEGVFISTPTGYFEVAEACSGVKFLIAMMAYGVLVAHVCFRSWPRRIAFVALSVLVPVLANGVRAWGTIYIAHHSSIDFAAGFDHVFYGWFFFAFVLALVMAIGWRFFDRKVSDPFLAEDDIAGLSAAAPRSGTPVVPALLAALLILPPVWGNLLATPPAAIASAGSPPLVAGWTLAGEREVHGWQPRADGANSSWLGRYQADGKAVDLFVALYDGQEEGREITGFGQGAIDPASDWAWTASGAPVANGRADLMTAPGPVVREALTFYRIGDRITGSALVVKLETIKARLLHQPVSAAMIILSAERSDDVPARDAVDAFLRDAGGIEKIAAHYAITE
ncbi:MAG: exosortase A [Blastomonas sp.]